MRFVQGELIQARQRFQEKTPQEGISGPEIGQRVHDVPHPPTRSDNRNNRVR